MRCCSARRREQGEPISPVFALKLFSANLFQVLKICRIKEHHLDQGWFAVKNRSVQERRDGFDLNQRNASENVFFARDPWNHLSHNRAGLTPLKEFLGDMVYGILQEDIDILLLKIQMMTEPTSGVRFASSIDSRRPVDENRDSLDQRHPVSEYVPEVDETSSSEQDPDLEVGEIKRRPTILTSACSVGLTLTLVLTLIGLGCHELAQEVATDGDWFRLFLLVTALL